MKKFTHSFILSFMLIAFSDLSFALTENIRYGQWWFTGSRTAFIGGFQQLTICEYQRSRYKDGYGSLQNELKMIQVINSHCPSAWTLG